MKQQNKQFTQMLQFHVSWLCCYFILVTLLPCCHVSRYKKLMLHSHVALLPFTRNQVWNKYNCKCCICMFQGQWHDEIDDAYVYEMTCNFVEAKHLGCYNYVCHGKTVPLFLLVSLPWARFLLRTHMQIHCLFHFPIKWFEEDNFTFTKKEEEEDNFNFKEPIE